jgi:hypothetical protein
MPYLLINDKWIYLIWAIKNLSNGCWFGAFEMFYSLIHYVDWWWDPLLVLWNSLFNFGYVYTIVRDFVLFFLNDVRTPIKSLKIFGKNIGMLYYFVFLSTYFTISFHTLNPDPHRLEKIDETEKLYHE